MPLHDMLTTSITNYSVEFRCLDHLLTSVGLLASIVPWYFIKRVSVVKFGQKALYTIPTRPPFWSIQEVLQYIKDLVKPCRRVIQLTLTQGFPYLLIKELIHCLLHTGILWIEHILGNVALNNCFFNNKSNCSCFFYLFLYDYTFSTLSQWVTLFS